MNDALLMSHVTLRPYATADEDAAIELWRRTWAKHYPHLDFNARVPWWRERWRKELVPSAQIVLAERGDALVGFVTVDPKTKYLDQIVVARTLGFGYRADSAQGGQAAVAGGARSARQQGQFSRDRLLRQARLCLRRRRQK